MICYVCPVCGFAAVFVRFKVNGLVMARCDNVSCSMSDVLEFDIADSLTP